MRQTSEIWSTGFSLGELFRANNSENKYWVMWLVSENLSLNFSIWLVTIRIRYCVNGVLDYFSYFANAFQYQRSSWSSRSDLISIDLGEKYSSMVNESPSDAAREAFKGMYVT